MNIVLSLAWLHDHLLMASSIVLGLAFPTLIVNGKTLITRHGEAFTKQLLAEYVASERSE